MTEPKTRQEVSKNTLENIKIMAFASQLERLYSINKSEGKINYVAGLCGPFFMFNSLYDYLTEKGFKIEFDVKDGGTEDDVKKHLWKIAKSSAAMETITKKLSEEKHKELQIKIYKSELLYLCLVQLFNNKGKELSFDNPDGSKMKALRFTDDLEVENNIKIYLENKAARMI